MKGRRLFLLASAIVWLIVLVLIVVAAVDRLSVTPWGNISGDERSAEIVGSVKVGQQFVAPLPGLYRIDVTLDPDLVQNPRPAVFRLQDGTDSTNSIAIDEFLTGDVKENSPYSLEFPPIQDSAGRSFEFSLESPQSSP